MYEDEDRNFFDEVYQIWAKSTDSGDSYWMPEEGDGEGKGYSTLWSVNHAGEKRMIGWGLKEADAEFIAGIHGAVPDLVRRLHEAIDEAVRKDEANDEAQNDLADALLENIELRGRLHDLEVEVGVSQR